MLAEIGQQLTRARNTDLAESQRGVRANDRVKRLVADFGIQSRYAGSICIDSDAAVRAAKEGLWRHRAGLRRAVATLERRTAALSRAECGCRERRGCVRCREGYKSANERWQKQRRLASRRAELARVDKQLAERRYPVVYGGRRLANTRHHLGTAGLSEKQWHAVWEEARFWFGCVGNTGRPGGNPCLTLRREADGLHYLTVSVPAPVAERLGVPTRVRLSHPVPLHHRSAELAQRLEDRGAVRLDIEPVTDPRGRRKVYLRAAWVRPTTEPATLPAARAGGVVGIDLNADHLATTRLDTSGNPVGRPIRVPLDLKDASRPTRDGRLRAAITATLNYAVATGATAIAIEDLDFADGKTREKFGRRKAFRHLIHGFPTTQFQDRVVAMAATQGLAVIAVDPRYTSRYGGASWQRALSTPTVLATRHEGASVAIGRRALGHGLTTRSRGGSPRPRPVPHQCDGSSTLGHRAEGQEQATADTVQADAQPGDHTPPVHTRRPSRRPPRTSGVDTPEEPPEQVSAGHRFTGSPPGG